MQELVVIFSFKNKSIVVAKNLLKVKIAKMMPKSYYKINLMSAIAIKFQTLLRINILIALPKMTL